MTIATVLSCQFLVLASGISAQTPAEDVLVPMADAKGEVRLSLKDARGPFPGKFAVLGEDEFVVDSRACSTSDAGALWNVVLNQTEPEPVTIALDGLVEKSDHRGRRCLYVDAYLVDGTALYTNVGEFNGLFSEGWKTARVTLTPSVPIRELSVYALLRKTASRMRFRPPRILRTNARDLTFDGLRIRPVAGPVKEGFYVRDVRAGSGFSPIRDVAKSLRLDVKEEASGGGRVFDVTLSDLKGEDRAVTLVYALPLPKGGLSWHVTPRDAIRLAADDRERSVVKNWSIAAGGLSRWPFGAVSSGTNGWALGIDGTAPAYFRTFVNPKLSLLCMAFDVGLASEKPSAHFRFCRFSFDGLLGQRGAIERYREIFPAAHAVRLREHGQWMAFMKIGDVPRWEDFGFRIMEGTEALAWDDAHGMLTFQYTEPGTWWMKRDPAQGTDLAKAEEDVRTLAARGNAEALAWETSVTRDVTGRPDGRFIDTPWCKGVVWSLNPSPGLAGEVTDFSHKIGDEVLKSRGYDRPFPCGVDGEYVDSADLYCTATADYDRRHFRGAVTPLCFDSEGRPVVFKGLACQEYVKSLADRLRPQGRFVMINSAPRDWCWLTPFGDVFGDEVNWTPSGGWKPTTEELMLYKLVTCCGKPNCFLMNTDLSTLTHEKVERYMRRCLAYGFFPGLNSKTDGCHYYSRRDLLDRDRDLHLKYIPLVKRVSEAGWRPVNRLCSSANRKVPVEQFGDRYVTVFNDTGRAGTFELEIKGSATGAQELVCGRRLDVKDGRLSLSLETEGVAVLDFK